MKNLKKCNNCVSNKLVFWLTFFCS